MERRRFLATLGGLAAGLMGCLAAPQSPTCGAGRDHGGTADAPSAAADRSGGEGQAPSPADRFHADLSPPVPQRELVQGTTRDAIQAIDDPAFGADWSAVDRSLTADDLVIGVERDGRARAYPLATLSSHEVVNDDLGGPLLATYCPLCGSAMTAERTVRGEPTVFGVSGLLFRSNLVLYDRRTESLWSQLAARSIRGPAAGDRLTLVASTVATWETWRGDHPDGDVLLPPPASGTVSTIPEGMPAGVHGHVGVRGVRVGFKDDRLPEAAVVVGVATADAARAYSLDHVRGAGAVNDCVGSLPVVVAASKLPYAYDRRVDGDVLRFARAGPNRLRAGGSLWSVTTGEAVSGPNEGRRLARPRGATTARWFAWVDFHPETTVYGE
jgi:hypothetical protein